MLKRKTALAALAMAGVVWGGSTQIAQAQSTCNLATAKLSLETEVLCECKVVTSQMLRYIQRQDEFLNVLANVTQECPAFANALNALPTATTFVERILHRDKDGGGPFEVPTSPPTKPPTNTGGGGGGAWVGGGGGAGGVITNHPDYPAARRSSSIPVSPGYTSSIVIGGCGTGWHQA